MEAITNFFELTESIFLLLAAIYFLLILFTAIGFIQKKMKSKSADEILLRIRSWWIILILLTLGIGLGKYGVISFFALVSGLALKEYLAVVPNRGVDSRSFLWAYLSIPIQYYFVSRGQFTLFLSFIPVILFLWLPTRMVIVGETKGFLMTVAILQWGVMCTVFCISHIPFLLVISAHEKFSVGIGYIILLLLLTELNDVFQFVWGKTFGRHKIIPKVSPNKTWEGFIGGALTTALISLLLSPIFAHTTVFLALAIGFVIAIAGFIGDVVLSAVKRDLNLKDFSQILPGHGGILDRIDSLTFTSPLFFYLVKHFNS